MNQLENANPPAPKVENADAVKTPDSNKSEGQKRREARIAKIEAEEAEIKARVDADAREKAKNLPQTSDKEPGNPEKLANTEKDLMKAYENSEEAPEPGAKNENEGPQKQEAGSNKKTEGIFDKALGRLKNLFSKDPSKNPESGAADIAKETNTEKGRGLHNVIMNVMGKFPKEPEGLSDEAKAKMPEIKQVIANAQEEKAKSQLMFHAEEMYSGATNESEVLADYEKMAAGEMYQKMIVDQKWEFDNQRLVLDTGEQRQRIVSYLKSNGLEEDADKYSK
jgi:hypothetical protein